MLFIKFSIKKIFFDVLGSTDQKWKCHVILSTGLQLAVVQFNLYQDSRQPIMATLLILLTKWGFLCHFLATADLHTQKCKYIYIQYSQIINIEVNSQDSKNQNAWIVPCLFNIASLDHLNLLKIIFFKSTYFIVNFLSK